MSLPRMTVRQILIVVALSAVTLTIARGVHDAVASAQDAGHRTRCANNLRNIGLALFDYQTSRGGFPRGTIPATGLPPEKRLGLFVIIWSFFDLQGIGILWEKDLPWDSRQNLLPPVQVSPTDGPSWVQPSTTPPAFPARCLTCPTNPSRTGPGLPPALHYVGIAGLGTDSPELPATHPRAGIFGYDRQTRFEDIKDGASETMLVAETALRNGPWTAGGPASVRGLDSQRQPYIGQGRQFGGTHRGGLNVAFADGSVRFITETVPPRLFEGAATIAGGERLPAGWAEPTQ